MNWNIIRQELSKNLHICLAYSGVVKFKNFII